MLWDIPDLSTDFIDFGRELGRAAGAILDRHALLAAIETGAAARTRLSLARDVHDSIVQFLAGAAFRVEAIKRAAKVGRRGRRRPRRAEAPAGRGAGRDPRLRARASPRPRARACRGRRGAARARRAPQPAMVGRLPGQRRMARSASIPIRLQLDLQQLLREAVANAVRHGGADRIDVGLAVDDGRLAAQRRRQWLRLSPRPTASRSSSPGRSRSGSSAPTARSALVSAPGSTNILISLPLAEPPRDQSPACRRPSDDRRRARDAAARTPTTSCSAAPAPPPRRPAQIAKQKPDLLLLDVHLPDGSGLDVLRRLSRAAQAAQGDPADRRHGRIAAARRRRPRARRHGAQDLRSEPAARMHGRGRRGRALGRSRRSPSARARRRSARPRRRR